MRMCIRYLPKHGDTLGVLERGIEGTVLSTGVLGSSTRVVSYRL